MTATSLESQHTSTHRQDNVSFFRVVNSEWIKLRTLRSTIWCFGLIVFLTIAFGLLLALTLDIPKEFVLDSATQNSFLVTVATLGVNFTQLIAAVLGVLIISGEYTTGMIRSTFTAVPTRLPAVFAKMLVLAISTFVVGLVSIVATALIAVPLLAGKGVHADLLDGEVLRALVGGAGYLALIALLSFGFGAILRNSAGGIASALGLILVVPSVLAIVSAITRATWVQNVSTFLPSNAGSLMFGYSTGEQTVGGPPAPEAGVITLDTLQGFLVLVAWVVVLAVISLVLVKRRDA